MGDFAFTPLEGEANPSPAWQFQPLDAAGTTARGSDSVYRFVPLDTQGAKPSLLKTIALENPATALGETALNLGSQAIALPVAGLAGLVTEAGHALGLTDKTGADVVHAVGDALTYQPRGEMGKATTELAAYPFQKLAEAGQAAGTATLEATGSPAAATAVDTTIQAVLPMVIGSAGKSIRAVREKSPTRSATNEKATAESSTNSEAHPQAASAAEPEASHQAGSPGDAPTHRFVPLSDDPAARPVQAGAERLAGDDPAMHGAATEGLAEVRRGGDNRLPGVDGKFRFVPVEHGTGADTAALAGTAGRETGLLPRELSVDRADSSGAAPGLLPEGDYPRADGYGGRGGEIPGAAEEGYRFTPAGERPAVGESPRGEALPGLDVADVQREGPATTGMGAADRPAVSGAVAADQERHAPGAGADAGPLPHQRTARYALIEADTLKASHDTDLRSMPENPFGRQDAPRADQEAAVQSIVKGFDPERLGAALDDAEGAPIVASDGIVEAGQRRAVAVQRIFQANGLKAENYRQFIRDNADRFGLVPEQVDTLKKPVLVRVPDEPAPRGAPVRAQVGEADVQSLDMAAGVQNGTWNPGAQYTPFVDQVREPVSSAKTVADLPSPIRREQIIGDLAKALGATVYEGRVKGKNRLGFFRHGVEEVRTKHAADIEVAAHELAHLIDSRVPKIASSWRSDKALREDLKSVSYNQQSVPEGFAEAVRLWMTQPEALEAKAPKAHAWLEDFAGSHEYGPALRIAQERMTAWFGQDALNRARSKIGTEKPLAEYFDRFWDKLRQSTVDDLHGVYRMERDLTGKINPNGPYESARLSRASASIADGAVRFGYPEKLPDGSFKFAGKGLEEILKPVADSLDDTLLFFVAKSSAELMSQGREHLFTRGEIDAMLRLRTPEREKTFQEYQAWNRGILDFAEAQGVINPEARRLWQRTQYLPFHRVDQPGGIKGKPGDWAGIQALTGGTTNIKDVLGNMVGNAAMLLDKAVKNEARVKVAKLSQRAGGGKFMVKIDTEARPVKVSGDQVLDAMLKRYGIAVDGDAPAFFEFLIKGQPPAGNNVVAVLQGGKPVWFEVGDPILYRALKAIDRPVQSEVVRWLGLPKRIGQATITATPDFWMANIARDTLMGSVMSRSGFRPILDSLKGMRSRMTSDPTYRDFLANGGGLSSIYLDEAKLRTKLEKFYGRQGIDYRTVLDTPSKLLNMIETLGDAFEMSTRLGEFKRAKERGENPRHAAYQGREVSTDFAMRGDSKALGFMYDTVMLLRPALVSWDRLYRGLAHDPNKGVIAAKAGTMALLSAGLYLLNRDDPRYADLPDWDRDANWHFFIGDQHFRWPKIWEIGALASAAERSVEKIVAEDADGLGKDFARILGATFSVNLMPQIIAPLAEQAANRNSFTGAPIETPGQEDLQPFLRAKPGTSETMKAMGLATGDMPESLQVNPARAEALLRGYFNTFATYGLMLSDVAFFGDKLPTKRADELPVVRRFYAQEPARQTRYESVFYDMLSEAQRLRGTLKELDGMGRSDWADRKEQNPLAGEAKPLERAQKSLTRINRDLAAVRRAPDLTPDEKRQRLDGLMVERNALIKQAVIEAKAAQKAKALTPADVAARGAFPE